MIVIYWGYKLILLSIYGVAMWFVYRKFLKAKITSGAELFGNFTRLKNGELAKNGTEAREITLSDGVKISA